MLDQESYNIVSKTWPCQIQGSRFFRVQQKLIRVKIALKEWAKNKYGNNVNKLQLSEEKIKDLENKLQLQHFNPILVSYLHRMLQQQEQLFLLGQKD